MYLYMHIIQEWLSSIAECHSMGFYQRNCHHRYSRLLRLRRNKKKGAPTSAVKTPTGNTAGANIGDTRAEPGGNWIIAPPQGRKKKGDVAKKCEWGLSVRIGVGSPSNGALNPTPANSKVTTGV